MTEQEYNELQELFSKKLTKGSSNRESAYDEAILACKSILSQYYHYNIQRKVK